MYTVVYIRTVVWNYDDYADIETIHTYHTKFRKVAMAYMDRRWESTLKKVNRKIDANDGTMEDIYVSSNDISVPYRRVEYVERDPDTGGTRIVAERYYMMRSGEILDLPNGPSLKVE